MGSPMSLTTTRPRPRPPAALSAVAAAVWTLGCLGASLPPIHAPDEHMVAVDVDVGFGAERRDGHAPRGSFSTDLRVGWHGMSPRYIVGAQLAARYHDLVEAPTLSSPGNWAVGMNLELIHILTGLNLRVGPLVALDGSVGFTALAGWSVFGAETTFLAGRRARLQTLFVLRLPVSLVGYALAENRRLGRSIR